MLSSFSFHFFPKYCKYTITTINNNDSLHFSPIPDAQIRRNKKSNDKANDDQVRGRGPRDVVMCALQWGAGAFGMRMQI